jgi:hypothetical protein
MTQLDLAVRLAAILLTTDGELSISDIEAPPFVDDYEAATKIATILLERFPAEVFQRRYERPSGLGRWEDMIRLKSSHSSEVENLVRQPSVHAADQRLSARSWKT